MNARHRISLDGSWQFHFDLHGQATPDNLKDRSPWRTAMVPMPWQAQFPDLRNRGGIGWYRRSFRLAERGAETAGRAAILHFGAVDYHATVWINGHLACEHEGGYLPFETDIAPLLVEGDNELVVRVIDPDEDSAPDSMFHFSEIPHGKQSWYGQTSGIWQSVWLELRSPTHFRGLKLTPDPRSAKIAVAAPLTGVGDVDPSLSVELTVRDPKGAPVGRCRVAPDVSEPGEIIVELDGGNVTRWSPEQPALYTVEALLWRDGRIVDALTDACGFRTVEARNGRIYLNGDPIYLRGALDQAYYPETIYTPPSLEYLENQFARAKALGFNCLRCHIKIEDPRYYALADRMGLLIWAELPNWMHLSPAAARRAEETFAMMVARDWNRPSIIAWTIINEDWGTDLVNDGSHRRWLVDFFARAKELDPTRLIVDNSPCHPNAHVVSDIEDYHHYRAIPDHAAEWDAWVADLAARPRWTWSPDYEHLRRADIPLIVSEFGNWGLVDPRQLRENDDAPWWADSGYDWREGIVAPRGLEARFHGWRLERVFGSFDSFIRASQEQMARNLAYEITAMRKHPSIAGYVVTELTDVHWEANGVMDFRRKVKAGVAEQLTPVNREYAVLIEPSTWSVEPGALMTVRLTTVGDSGPTGGGSLRWRVGAVDGEMAAPGGDFQLAAPQTAQSQLLTIVAEWRDGDQVLATNEVQIACLDTGPRRAQLTVNGAEELAATLSQRGYSVRPLDALSAAEPSPTIVTRSFSRDIQDRIRNGARAILLAGEEYVDNPRNIPLPFGDQTRIIRRRDTWWEGDWASSFSWLHKRGPFAHMPGGPMLDMPYADIMPRTLLTIEPHRLLKQNIWSGLAVGWLQKVVGLVACGNYGRGKLVICTFHLTPANIRDNAIARGLFNGLINLAAAGGPETS